jgi:hypothetical protein
MVVACVKYHETGGTDKCGDYNWRSLGYKVRRLVTTYLTFNTIKEVKYARPKELPF